MTAQESSGTWSKLGPCWNYSMLHGMNYGINHISGEFNF
jgi:hypothetical protein